MRKQYDKEFKIHAAKLVVQTGKAVAQVARELDIAERTLHNWVKKYKESEDGSDFISSGDSAPEDKVVKDLQKKLRDLEEENAIFKKGYGHLRQRPEVIYNFIEQHQHEFRVMKMCQVLGVSKSGYYHWRKREKSNQQLCCEELTRHIKEIYINSRPIYGSPKIMKKLNQ